MTILCRKHSFQAFLNSFSDCIPSRRELDGNVGNTGRKKYAQVYRYLRYRYTGTKNIGTPKRRFGRDGEYRNGRLVKLRAI